MESLQGHLLVASPQLPDPNFLRSVVLIVEHDETGAFGLILNRTTTKKLSDLWERFAVTPCPSDSRIAVGGPVDGPLLALHGNPGLSEIEVVPGVFLARTRDCLADLIDQADHPYRIFIGYAGWGSGQLDMEMEVGSWLSMRATQKHVFEIDEDSIWNEVILSIGGEQTRNVLGTRMVIDDPTLN